MPAPKSEQVYNGTRTTELFCRLEAERHDAAERNDCAVKAVAIVTGRPYKEVLDFINSRGRKPKDGTPPIGSSSRRCNTSGSARRECRVVT